MQWKNEITTHTDGMKVLVWHGASRITDVNELKKYDVVLTTYAVLERYLFRLILRIKTYISQFLSKAEIRF